MSILGGPLPKTTTSSTATNLIKNAPDIGTQNKFMSPGMTAALDFGFGAAASFYDHQFKKYE